ncbi:hypothetical protein AB0L85_04565 [Streptomyces sp. NPDC052051]|uniref:hypothetical protein n=1 Tax=Streptomyces sp. NPDC052051 TaxID=3154649 RepID=UPI003444D542
MPLYTSGLVRVQRAMFVACLLALVGCNPHMYDSVPALYDAKRSEVPGTWLCYDRTTVVLRPDGTADIRLLDGQEFDFDHRWRLSGKGRWKLTDQRAGWNDGQHVRLSLTARTGAATREPEPGETSDAADAPPPPRTYTWTFELERDDEDALRLYFFFGDPDSRSTYVLVRQDA